MKEFSRYRCVLVKEDSVPYCASESLKCSDDVYDVIRSLGYDSCTEEYVGMFSMDTNGKIIGSHEVSHGGLACATVEARDVFKRALLDNATYIILFHNHPSGALTASEQDIIVTKRLAEAGRLLGAMLQDHIIVSLEGHVSLRKENPEIFQ